MAEGMVFADRYGTREAFEGRWQTEGLLGRWLGRSLDPHQV